MNKDKEDFNRGKCFTFFSTFYEQGKQIEEIYGKEKALDYYNAIIEYALNQKQIKDPEIMILVGHATLDVVDRSQNRREKVYRGEDMKLTEVILTTLRDHPEISQEKLAKKVGCSKGKVNRVLTKFKNGGYEDIFDFNVVINGIVYTPSGESGQHSNNNKYKDKDKSKDKDKDNTNSNNNSSDRDRRDRDRCAVTSHCSDLGSLTEGVANAPDVADAPSRFAPQHTYTESVIRELRFNGKIPDTEMPDIIQRQYNNLMSLVSNGDMDIEDVRDSMIQEFTTGFYGCNREPISIYVDYLITHNGLTEK